jgi:hypothetical protein
MLAPGVRRWSAHGELPDADLLVIDRLLMTDLQFDSL